jgi:hypothetical protein
MCLESCQKSIPVTRIHKIGCIWIANGSNGVYFPLPTPAVTIRLN